MHMAKLKREVERWWRVSSVSVLAQSSLFPESNTSSQGAVRSNRFDLSPVSTATSCKSESKDGF